MNTTDLINKTVKVNGKSGMVNCINLVNGEHERLTITFYDEDVKNFKKTIHVYTNEQINEEKIKIKDILKTVDSCQCLSYGQFLRSLSQEDFNKHLSKVKNTEEFAYKLIKLANLKNVYIWDFDKAYNGDYLRVA